MSDYGDRFDASKYADEQPHVLRRLGAPEASAVAVPATVMWRLLAVGGGYGLHVLGSVLEPGKEHVLNRDQCASLADELEWVGRLLNDPLVSSALPAILGVVLACARSSKADAELALDLEF